MFNCLQNTCTFAHPFHTCEQANHDDKNINSRECIAINATDSIFINKYKHSSVLKIFWNVNLFTFRSNSIFFFLPMEKFQSSVSQHLRWHFHTPRWWFLIFYPVRQNRNFANSGTVSWKMKNIQRSKLTYILNLHSCVFKMQIANVQRKRIAKTLKLSYLLYAN